MDHIALPGGSRLIRWWSTIGRHESPGEPQDFQRHNLWLTDHSLLLPESYCDPTSYIPVPECRVTRGYHPMTLLMREFTSSVLTSCVSPRFFAYPRARSNWCFPIGFLYPWRTACSIPFVTKPSASVRPPSLDFYIPKSGGTAAYIDPAEITNFRNESIG